MKKKLELFLLAIILLALNGCNFSNYNKEEIIICTLEIENKIIISNKSIANGDIVITQTQESLLSYDYKTKEELKQDAITYGLQYDVSGVEYHMDYKNDGAVEVITIDYKKADMKELHQAGLIKDANISKVSLKMTVKELKSNGFTCKNMEEIR